MRAALTTKRWFGRLMGDASHISYVINLCVCGSYRFICRLSLSIPIPTDRPRLDWPNTAAIMSHHADSTLLPASIHTKSQFWGHVISQLVPLLDGQRHWVNGSPRLPTLSCPLTVPSFASAVRSHPGDQSSQHVFSRLSLFTLVSRFRRRPFLRELVW
jgi:hypothetical protein